MLKKIDAVVEWISKWILVISGIGVCTLIFAGAFCRYVLKTDFYGSEELILVAAFWLYFFGSSLAAKYDTHIKAEMLGMFVKNKKVLGIANIITMIINLAMLVMATIWSWQYLKWNNDMHMVSNVFRFPTVIPVLPVFISFLIWLCYGIRDLLKAFKSFNNIEKEAAE